MNNFLELRKIVESRILELERFELRQETKIKLNGNVSYKPRYEREMRSIIRAKEINMRFKKYMEQK